ncbi:MAG: type I 3-dehydroquinate dehydratase [Streptococcaceae bacterium]|nr:type I 3-dehydroquinate dehydratase [Streptococcaceae bacterium]
MNRPLIFGSILPQNAGEIDSLMVDANASHADWIEFRADKLNHPRKVFKHLSKQMKPILFTYRSTREGGFGNLTPLEVETLLADSLDYFDMIDVEATLPEESLRRLRRLATQKGKKILLSCHEFETDLPESVRQMKIDTLFKKKADVYKIAILAENESVLRLLQEKGQQYATTPHIFIAMGEKGLDTRMNPEKYGSLGIFAGVKGALAPGQKNVEETYAFFTEGKV